MIELRKIFGYSLIVISCFSCKKDSTPGLPQIEPVTVDSFTVNVQNGFGGGKYKIRDTVHIWAAAIDDGHVFDSWIGFPAMISDPGEWSNSFIMPGQDVNVTATLKSSVPFSLTHEQIRGRNILKNVYYYFPAMNKGMVWLLHGTGGSAQNIVSNFEWQQMIKDLVSDGFAVVLTESEETSLGDINADGKIRWNTFPTDSINNVDYANIKALRDTFYARGNVISSQPIYSIGMSNGGAFSAALSAYFKFKAGVSYCASGAAAVFTSSQTAFQFCMSKYDDNAEVGPQGNADALTNSQNLLNAGVCSKYFLHDRSPVYPERFARRADITLATSNGIFYELQANDWLDTKRYLTSSSTNIILDLQANAANYPTLNALTAEQKSYISGQIDVMFAGHQFHSDYNRTTISFLNRQCQ